MSLMGQFILVIGSNVSIRWLGLMEVELIFNWTNCVTELTILKVSVLVLDNKV